MNCLRGVSILIVESLTCAEMGTAQTPKNAFKEGREVGRASTAALQEAEANGSFDDAPEAAASFRRRFDLLSEVHSRIRPATWNMCRAILEEIVGSHILVRCGKGLCQWGCQRYPELMKEPQNAATDTQKW